MRKRLLIAGASGSVGFHALRLAHEQGLWTRTLSQNRWRAAKVSLFADSLWMRDATQPESIHGICSGVDAVLSCMGCNPASGASGSRSALESHLQANLNLLQEAREAEVPRFVYLSVFSQQGRENTPFVRAHRRFEAALRASGLKFTVLRITETFASFDSMVELARKGRVPLIGRGHTRVNPIHPEDAARLCVSHAFEGPEVVDAGGPEVLTRREIARQVFSAIIRDPDPVPSFILRLTGTLVRPLQSGAAHLLEFLPTVSGSDAIAPAHGQQPFADYLRTLRDSASRTISEAA